MDAFASSSNGIIKAVDFKNNSYINLNEFRSLTVPDETITCAAWANGEKTQVLCALLNRSLRLFDGDFKEVMKVAGGEGPIKGVVPMDSSILTAVEDGTVQMHSIDGQQLSNVKCGTHIQTVSQSPTKPSCIAVGGHENPLQVFDMTHPEKPLFSAKNVKDDFLCIRKKVNESGIVWETDGRCIVTCTGHNQLRVYDPDSGQRKPVKEVTFSDHPFTCLTRCNRERHVVAGTTDGRLGLFDLRGKRGFLVHAYKGFAGSVADVTAHPTKPVILSCSPDRFLRVHHLDNKQLMHKIYVKSRINKVLMRDELSILNESDSDSEIEETQKIEEKDDGVSSDEEVWGGMQKTDRKRKAELKAEMGKVENKRRKQQLLKRTAENFEDSEPPKRQKKMHNRKRRVAD